MKTRGDSVFLFFAFTLLTLPFFTSAYINRDDYERDGLFVSFHNSSLKGSSIKAVQVKSSIDCVHECLRHPECGSVNFQSNGDPEHLCELCGVVETGLKCPENNPGYTHMTPSQGNNLTCITSPCLHGGTCVRDCSLASGYRCMCSLFNTGQNCEKWTATHCNALPLGLEDRTIGDSQLSASSTANNYHHPKYARLNALPGSKDAGSWRGASRIDEYFQVDLLETKMITKVATQGRPKDRYNRNHWITRYSLSYRVDGGAWVSYQGQEPSTKIFDGNSDRSTVVTHSLGVDVPIVARYIRIVVKGYAAEGPSLRAELYGCDI